jgi:hypothetical protein
MQEQPLVNQNVDDLILTTVSNTIKPEPETVPDVAESTNEYGVETAQEEAPESTELDDYGNPVEKKERVYTEAEVQAMIRKRIKEKHEPQQPAPQPQYESPIDDNWEHQLESFVEQTLSKREQKLQEERWKAHEQETQANFEIKFNTGASKYKDFEQVVVGKPLTPQMVLATRGMNDPAAFIYAAAKTQAPELDRISKISDPYVQAVELGKLEERMKKARPINSQAPKPIANIKGDMVEAKQKPRSIDDILAAEENARRKARLQRGR